jgi:DNA polymerase III subunit chi
MPAMPTKPTVRFYVLPDGSGLENRLELACKLAEKAQQERLKTLIICADEHMAAQLDHALWHYRADSFLTHCRPGDPLEAEAAVLLAVPPERIARTDVLINLSQETAPDLPRDCARVFEIVTPQPDVLQSTRRRYAAYRERELEPQTHHLGKP